MPGPRTVTFTHLRGPASALSVVTTIRARHWGQVAGGLITVTALTTHRQKLHGPAKRAVCKAFPEGPGEADQRRRGAAWAYTSRQAPGRPQEGPPRSMIYTCFPPLLRPGQDHSLWWRLAGFEGCASQSPPRPWPTAQGSELGVGWECQQSWSSLCPARGLAGSTPGAALPAGSKLAGVSRGQLLV